MILISGPVTLPAPARIELLPVRTAVEMRRAVMDHPEQATMVIKAAAVADYHRTNPPQQRSRRPRRGCRSNSIQRRISR